MTRDEPDRRPGSSGRTAGTECAGVPDVSTAGPPRRLPAGKDDSPTGAHGRAGQEMLGSGQFREEAGRRRR